MEEVIWAAAAAVVALVPPVRRRFLPVSKAVLSASLGVAAAALRAVACGDQPAPKTGTDAANGQVTAAPRPKRARAASTKPL